MHGLSKNLSLAIVLLTARAAGADEDPRPRIEVSASIQGKSTELARELIEVSLTDSNPSLKGHAESYLASRARQVLTPKVPVFRFDLDDGGKEDASTLRFEISDKSGYDPWPLGRIVKVTVTLSVSGTDQAPVTLPMTFAQQQDDVPERALCNAFDDTISDWVETKNPFRAVPFRDARARRSAGANKSLIRDAMVALRTWP